MIKCKHFTCWSCDIDGAQDLALADARIRAVREIIERHGCDCPCDHHPDERGPDCEVCLACRIGAALAE